MKIKLSNEYYIEKVDDLNYCLKKTYTSYGSGSNQYDEPKVVTKTCGYYQKVEHALEGFAYKYLNDQIEPVECDVKEAADRIKEIMTDAVKKMERLAK